MLPQPAPLQSLSLGDFKVTYLPDGVGRFKALATFPNSTADEWRSYRDLVDMEDHMVTTIGGFLIQTSDRNIIVDTGTGPMTIDFPGFGPLMGGDYLASFARTGLAREDVTDVLFTHLHLDHCGWTTVEVDGQRELTFPQARHTVTQTEWNFWYGGDHPAGPHPLFVQQPLADKIAFLETGRDFVPGLHVLDTAGHTPGHISLLITVGEERLFLTADIWHTPAQVHERQWSMAFDFDPAQATAARWQLFPDLIKPNTLVASNHFCNTVFGRIVADNGDYRWAPLEM